MSSIEISCSFPPGPHSVEHIELAESLGYRRAWLYDSPAMYFDVWATMALAADHTKTIELGTAVIVPRLRHLMVTASAIATMESLAPGRFTLGVGTGFTGAKALNEKPMRWSELVDHVVALRALLRGETVEWQGRKLQLMYDDGYMAALPIEVPIIFGADGPKGLAAAREHGDGVFTTLAKAGDFERSIRLATGTVLEAGESIESDRVWRAAGHAAATSYHVAYEFDRDMSAFPNAEAYRASIDSMPDDERHLLLHKGHVTTVSEHDERFVPRSAVATLTFTGTAEELAARCAKQASRGVTEIVYQPAGPDIPRELEAFARVGGLLGAMGQ